MIGDPTVSDEEKRKAMEAGKVARDLPTCTTCGMPKNPVGRDAPLAAANSLCNHECEGYWQEPKPGHLWPEEMREEPQS